jgi:RNA polymerase sigma factor for flagellar operon FliA
MTQSQRSPGNPHSTSPVGGPQPSPQPRADAPEVLERFREELPLVEIIAGQLRRQLGGKVMHDELLSFGREGLLAAARAFDHSLGVPFRRWANYRIRGAMLDGVRSNSLLPRSVYSRLRAIESAQHACEVAAEDGSVRYPASAEEAEARLESYLASVATAAAMGLLAAPVAGDKDDCVDPAPTADEVIARGETLALVREAVATLPDNERHLIERHYFEDVRLDEAAREIGVSKSWGSRLHLRAIEAITRHMKRAAPPG